MQAQPPAVPPQAPLTPVFGWYLPIPAPYPAPYAAPDPAAFAAPHPTSAAAPGAYAAAGTALSPLYGQMWYPPGPAWLGSRRFPSLAKVPHADPRPYLRLMRTVNYRWWRPLLGLLAFVGSYVVAAVIVTVAFLAAGVKPNLLRLDDLTDPVVLALTNASLIVAIPAVWVAWLAHTERIGWSSSVLGRIRWRLLLRYAALALPLMAAGILVGLLVGGGIGPTTGFNGREYLLLVLVVLLSTPLQAAAEEYVFRGYLSQAISSWIPNVKAGAIVAALITATLFSLAHAPGDLLTFFDRFAFGLAASAVVYLTGGLEAAIAFHAANNIVIFLVVGALGGSTSSDIQNGSGTAALSVALDIMVMVGFVWLVARLGSRWHPELVCRAIDPTAQVLTAGPSLNGWGVVAPGWGLAAPGWVAPAPQWLPPPAPAPWPPTP